MRKPDRRELLRMGLLALAAPAVRGDNPDPGKPIGTEREPIHWGETVAGLQAGLGVAHPSAGYAVGDRIELIPYVRNRTSKPIRFTYDQAVYEKTPSVWGPDGKELRVAGYIDLAAARAGTRVTLPAGGTLIVDHPGLWLTTDHPEGTQFPGVPEPRPGIYRIAQSIRLGIHSRDRAVIGSRLVTLLSESGKPYRAEAQFVPTSQTDTDRHVSTGTVEVTVSGAGGRAG